MTKDILDIHKEMAAAAAKTAKDERPASSFISLKGGCMTYQDEAVPGNQLECIIVGTITEKTWYDRAYDPDDTGPPECFAQNAEMSELAPHENVPDPVSTVCRGCPKAEFGTARQGKGPACKTYRKLAVMPSSALADASAIADAEIASLRVPPTSVKNWSTYANKVAGQGIPTWAVKTMIMVNPHPKKMFEVTFKAIEPIEDEATLAAIYARITQATETLLSPYEYDKEDEDEGDTEGEPKAKRKTKY